jgi:hypothetical protein
MLQEGGHRTVPLDVNAAFVLEHGQPSGPLRLKPPREPLKLGQIISDLLNRQRINILRPELLDY